eukprot:XP_016658347.1 PREDICTED: probable serine/threonine-protein kinase DDB_G0283337 [Acyrthosiphon pisum]
MVKNDFVNASTLINKAKKKARETDLYLKNLHEKVLPRCQSADITSDIVERDLYADIPSKTVRRLQPDLKENLGKNINANNENSNIISKPRSSIQEKRVHFNNRSGYLGRTINPHQLNDSSKSIEQLSKNDRQNVSITNVNFEANISDGKYNNDCKVNKLTVRRIPRIDLKADLVTQKLTNIQIQPDNKLLRNYKPNVAYQEFAFGLEPETCKCHSVIQPKISNDKIVARHEIRKIICGMLDNTSSNYCLSDRSISKLQKIINKLEKTKSLDYNDSSEVEDLIEEHSMVGFSEEVIKKRLLEIADNMVENDIDGISFDQISVEIENNSRQVLNRLTKIKNSIVALNPLVEFPNLPTDNKLDDAVQYVDENLKNHHPSNILSSKNLHEIPSTGCVSVKDFLRHGCNFTSSEIFKNASVIKECGSQITLCSNDNINQNKNIFKTQNALNNQNNISQLKKNHLKFQDQSTLFEDSVSSQPQSSHSSIILKHQLKLSDDENQNNDKNYGCMTTTNGYDWESENSLKINTLCKTNNETILTKSDQLTKFEKDKNTNMLKINTNIEHLPIKDTSKDYDNLQSNIQEWQLSSLSSLTSNNYQQTDKAQILAKKTKSFASTTSSMISLKQSTQEVESEAESLTSLGEVNYFSK